MDLFLAIAQGTGLALAVGVRPFLPPLLAGALARGDAGIDFSGTDFAFLESIPFLAAVLALTALATVVRRAPDSRVIAAFAAVAVALGALLFAGSLAEEDYAVAPGLLGGALAAAIGFAAATSLLSRAQARLATGADDSTASSYLSVYADAAALVLAALAIFAAPVSLVALALCVWLLLEQRRRGARKYEGLRVLR